MSLATRPDWCGRDCRFQVEMVPSHLKFLHESLTLLGSGFQDLASHPSEKVNDVALREVLHEVARRMHDNFPYPHPLYAGQMMKPPHPIALLAYSLAMSINPNNHALDGGRASSQMEKEAVAQIARMFGWEQHLGHLSSGGTMANLEALWISGRIHPGKKIVATSQAHHTHQRISDVLRLEFETVAVDKRARMDLDALETLLRRGDVGTVVATIGTTGVGAVDPLAEILALKGRYGFRVHADAAYGGYFTLVDNLDPETQSAFDQLDQTDSIVVDPHKHGLQPYGCGCVLFQDPSVGQIYRHDSPYTYFTSDELHLGEISLECSRPGAAAVALWATQRLLPLQTGGEFATGLENCRKAALALFERLRDDARFLTLFTPELDILVWAPKAASASEITNRSKQFFDQAAEANLHLALVELPSELTKRYWRNVQFDRSTVICLRSCLMKPEHLEWIDRIWEIVDRVAGKEA